MRKKALILGAIIAGAAAASAAPAKAQDASWGCQVLLCAASSNPSWHSVPYCVPPMTKLIAAMKLPGFSWPICREGKAGKPGKEEYADCPAGYSIGYSSYGRDDQYSRPDRCVKTINTCKNGRPRSYGRGDKEDCIRSVEMSRPRRADPWYFDIPDANGVKKRFWFNLNT
ncbi:hypothetical protein GCM10011491_41610 [Brucella endophytica]|uniref:Uncharacterized protein n=1 Tax=Brucella endophytica TaxID=1963359 RepID=A0A916WLG9_9HYPH|nr:hypothetical protein [Brucella endophytica]GGB09305.1 hypothetical protein GCM10011491_41610 [Brucella endophytica]